VGLPIKVSRAASFTDMLKIHGHADASAAARGRLRIQLHAEDLLAYTRPEDRYGRKRCTNLTLTFVMVLPAAARLDDAALVSRVSCGVASPSSTAGDARHRCLWFASDASSRR
jgi:hypothetical protein